MAWEPRSRGTSYYSRSRKVDGRVRREYVGAGLLGLVAAEEDAQRTINGVARVWCWIGLGLKTPQERRHELRDPTSE